MNDAALLTVEEMYLADRLAIEAGTSGLELMENAGAALEREVNKRWDRRPVVVLCGPGNNGGDGFVVARRLKDRGWPVRLALLGTVENLKGDAAVNARRWDGRVEDLSPDILNDRPLVIDALFGAGLARALEGAALACVEAINTDNLECVGVDVPSGTHGDTGEILRAAPKCALTVTFFRAKPGHLLMPGRALAGDLVIADIGTPNAVLDEIKPSVFINSPDLWEAQFPRPNMDAHKYARGHVVIRGGEEMTGAAQLVALGARRIGGGLVSISASEHAANIYRTGLPGNLVAAADTALEFSAFLADPRKNVIVIGPGMGATPETKEFVLAALATDRHIVLDADALTAFADDPAGLTSCLNQNHILTPHEGEFARIFSNQGSKITRTRAASSETGATILIKGADTVITASDGRSVINTTGTPYLATAGSGDVLAGMIAGLVAQGMEPFEAACSGVWMHGRAGEIIGPGLIAEDLPEELPDILEVVLNGDT